MYRTLDNVARIVAAMKFPEEFFVIEKTKKLVAIALAQEAVKELSKEGLKSSPV